jgi:hypothetical protein
VRWGSITANGWCYEQVCLAEMFKFSTNVIGKLAYSTCYLLVRFITTEFEFERKRFFFSFLCDGKY